MFGIMIMMRRLQQGFGGDTSDVETGSSQCAAHFDTGGFETELSGFDGGYVSAGAAADDYDVVLGLGGGGGKETVSGGGT